MKCPTCGKDAEDQVTAPTKMTADAKTIAIWIANIFYGEEAEEWDTACALSVAQIEAFAAQECDSRDKRIADLREYIIYTPCHVCGLPDPLRTATICLQCEKARAAIVRGEEAR